MLDQLMRNGVVTDRTDLVRLGNVATLAMTLGADNFVAGDKWIATISNNYTSIRQTWMAKSCGIQLPSA